MRKYSIYQNGRSYQGNWAPNPNQKLTPPKPFADGSISDEGSSTIDDNGEDFGFVAATLPHLPNPINMPGSPTSSSTSSSQTPTFQQQPQTG